MHRSNYSQPHARKGPAPVYQHPQQAAPQTTPQQDEYQRLQTRRTIDRARNASKKPTDREIPDELEDVVVGDGIERYKKLRDVERRLDAIMMRKRLDVSDNVNRRYTRREGKLRVWISNTADGQPWQVLEDGSIGYGNDGVFEFGESGQATYRVKIEGRLLEDERDDSGTKDAEMTNETRDDQDPRPRFSHFFKSIKIDFHRNPDLNSDGFSAIEWTKPDRGSPGYDPGSSQVNFDTLEFERKSTDNINVTISLVRDEKRERFKLSPLLAEILDSDEQDRAGAIRGIWEYARALGLQEDDDKRGIVCDEMLRKLFNKERVYFPYVPDLLMPHLHPLPPIQLSYTIRVDKAYIDHPTPTIYDIHVPLPDTLDPQLTRFHTSKTHVTDLQTIIRTDDELALLVQKIHQSNAKRKFFENLAKDPAAFVKRWTSSQRRDLEVFLAEEDGRGEEGMVGVGNSGLWQGNLARESVGLWLARAEKAK